MNIFFADDCIVLKKKKEARQGDRAKEIGRRTKGKEKSGRWYRPEKEERSEAGTKGKKRAE